MPNILIVDDEEIVREMLRDILAREGFETRGAEDGTAALETCAAGRPDLVILDVQLPDINGFDVCREMRREPRLRGMPIILLTARALSEEDEATGLNLGADDYIRKPFSSIELIARIRGALRHATGGASGSTAAPS